MIVLSVSATHPEFTKRKRVSESCEAQARSKRMGGDSNPRCLSAHTLSRRAQSTALSPIQVLDTLTANLLYGKLTASRL